MRWFLIENLIFWVVLQLAGSMIPVNKMCTTYGLINSTRARNPHANLRPRIGSIPDSLAALGFRNDRHAG